MMPEKLTEAIYESLSRRHCRVIAYYVIYSEIAGSVNAGLLLSQMIYWAGKTRDPSGWFYQTWRDWQTQTGLTRKQQQSTRRLLTERHFIEERLKGVPAKLYFKVNVQNIEDAVLRGDKCLSTGKRTHQDGQNDAALSPETPQQVGQKGSPLKLSESSAESTHEISSKDPPETRKTSLPEGREVFFLHDNGSDSEDLSVLDDESPCERDLREIANSSFGAWFTKVARQCGKDWADDRLTREERQELNEVAKQYGDERVSRWTYEFLADEKWSTESGMFWEYCRFKLMEGRHASNMQS